MNIRKIKPEDWKKLRKMLEVMAHEDPPVAVELEPLIFKTEKWIKSFPKENQGIFIVTEEEDMIIGFCYLVVPKFYALVAYIGIVVDKEHRGRNVGSQMFHHVAEWAVSQRLQYIIADVWSWNLGAIKFFQTLGFVEKSRFTDKFKGELKEKVRLVKKV